MSWDEGFPGARASRPHDDGFLGARASRPHQAWHSLGHLPHLDQPGTAPWLSFGLAAAVAADRVAACSIALKLSGSQRDRMRAGRPRSQGNHSPLEGESQKPSRQAKADAVGGERRATSQKADAHPLGNSRLPASRAPARPCRSFEEKRPIVNEDEPRMDTKEHEDRSTSFNHKRHQNASAISPLPPIPVIARRQANSRLHFPGILPNLKPAFLTGESHEGRNGPGGSQPIAG